MNYGQIFLRMLISSCAISITIYAVYAIILPASSGSQRSYVYLIGGIVFGFFSVWIFTFLRVNVDGFMRIAAAFGFGFMSALIILFLSLFLILNRLGG